MIKEASQIDEQQFHRFRFAPYDPKELFLEAQGAAKLARETGALHVVSMGSTVFPSGIFSSLEMKANFGANPEGYCFTATAIYRNASSQFWSPYEREHVEEVLKGKYGQRNVISLQAEGNISMISITDQQEWTTAALYLGWENETAEWQGMLESIAKIAKDPRYAHIQWPLLERVFGPRITDSLSVTPTLSMSLNTSSADRTANIPQQLLKLNGLKDYTRKLQKWTTVIATALQMIGEIKGENQTGMIQLQTGRPIEFS